MPFYPLHVRPEVFPPVIFATADPQVLAKDAFPYIVLSLVGAALLLAIVFSTTSLFTGSLLDALFYSRVGICILSLLVFVGLYTEVPEIFRRNHLSLFDFDESQSALFIGIAFGALLFILLFVHSVKQRREVARRGFRV